MTTQTLTPTLESAHLESELFGADDWTDQYRVVEQFKNTPTWFVNDVKGGTELVLTLEGDEWDIDFAMPDHTDDGLTVERDGQTATATVERDTDTVVFELTLPEVEN